MLNLFKKNKSSEKTSKQYLTDNDFIQYYNKHKYKYNKLTSNSNTLFIIFMLYCIDNKIIYMCERLKQLSYICITGMKKTNISKKECMVRFLDLGDDNDYDFQMYIETLFSDGWTGYKLKDYFHQNNIKEKIHYNHIKKVCKVLIDILY